MFVSRRKIVLHIYLQNKTSLKILTELSRYSCANSKYLAEERKILRLFKILTIDMILLIITIYGNVCAIFGHYSRLSNIIKHVKKIFRVSILIITFSLIT